MNSNARQEAKINEMAGYIRAAVIAVVVVAAGVGGWQLIQGQRHGKAERGFADLQLARKLEESAGKEAEALSKDSAALVPGDVMLKWSDDRKKEYEGKLHAVVEKFPDTAAGAIAGLKLAQWKFMQKQYDGARAAYQAVIDNAKSEEEAVYRAMAYEGLGVTLETEKNYDEARKTFDAAAALKANPLKPLAYMGSARVLVAQGKKDEAKGFYEKVVKEFPGSPYERKAKALMGLGE